MKLLIDAQLPRRMCEWFRAAGCDTLHTLDLPAANRTPDEDVIAVADVEDRIVVTKDDDFVTTHLIQDRPRRLLLVSTGNISNTALEQLLTPLIPDIAREFQVNSFIEVGRAGLIVRG